MNLNNQQLNNYGTRNHQLDFCSQPTHYQRYYTIMPTNPDQQIKISNNLTWRQTTSMPIVKVISYRDELIKDKTNQSKHIFKVQLENIIKSIDTLTNIDISQAVYIIRQALLGIQTLTVKYHIQFDISKWLIGINNKGQVKVWMSNNLMKEYSEISPKFLFNPNANKTNHAIKCLFELVKHCIKPIFKPFFSLIAKKLTTENQITYAQAHFRLRQICFQNKTIICDRLSIQRLCNRKSGSVQKSIKLSVDKNFKKTKQKQHKLSALSKNNFVPSHSKQSTGINFVKSKLSYNSPKHCIKFSNFKSKWHPSSHNKFNIAWSYGNTANKFNKVDRKLLGSVNYGRAYQRADQNIVNSAKKGLICLSLDGNTQLNLCKSVPNKLNGSKLKNQNLQNQQRQKQIEQVTIQQFQPYEEEDNSIQISKASQFKNSTSKKNQISLPNTRSTKNYQQSKPLFESSDFIQNFSQSKKSTTTTNHSINTDRFHESIQDFKQKCININKLQEMIDNTKNIINSIMIHTPLVNKLGQQPQRVYDFGEVINIQDKCQSARMSGNGEILGKQVESLEVSREDSAKNSQKLTINNIQSLNKIKFDLLCGMDLMSKLLSNDQRDLKQSVWCGQQKKASHMFIKLEKLGLLGRQIKGSYVPFEANE